MKPPAAILVCGVRVPVLVGSEEENPHLAGAYACYDIDTNTIWMHRDCPENSVHFWLTHEAKHAMLTMSGALRVTAAIFGIDMDTAKGRELVDLWEENFIRVTTPHDIETFGSPKGVK